MAAWAESLPAHSYPTHSFIHLTAPLQSVWELKIASLAPCLMSYPVVTYIQRASHITDITWFINRDDTKAHFLQGYTNICLQHLSCLYLGHFHFFAWFK